MVWSYTPTRRQLVDLAILVSIITILSNVVEGVLSMILGSQSNSVSLVIFGIGSLVEMTSSSLVLWRFLSEFREDSIELNKGAFVEKERKATLGIGSLFLILASGTFLHAIISLSQKSHPENTVAGLVISSVSIVFMLFVYYGKKYLAIKLDSSTMASEARCSLACIKITAVLFCSSLLYMLWQRAWWVDSAAALLFSVFFAKEGYEMVKLASSKNFTGGYMHGESKGDGKREISGREISGREISGREISGQEIGGREIKIPIEKVEEGGDGGGGGSIHAVREKEDDYSIEKNNAEETKDIGSFWGSRLNNIGNQSLEPRLSNLYNYQLVVC